MISTVKIDETLRQPGIAPLDRALLLAQRRRIFESNRPGAADDPANGSDRKGDG